jgi:hypothetical protein
MHINIKAFTLRGAPISDPSLMWPNIRSLLVRVAICIDSKGDVALVPKHNAKRKYGRVEAKLDAFLVSAPGSSTDPNGKAPSTCNTVRVKMCVGFKEPCSQSPDTGPILSQLNPAKNSTLYSPKARLNWPPRSPSLLPNEFGDYFPRDKAIEA